MTKKDTAFNIKISIFFWKFYSQKMTLIILLFLCEKYGIESQHKKQIHQIIL